MRYGYRFAYVAIILPPLYTQCKVAWIVSPEIEEKGIGN